MLWLVVVVTSLAVGARVRAVSEGAVCDARQDLDGDGAVTSFDLSLLLSAWGPVREREERCERCDAHTDGACVGSARRRGPAEAMPTVTAKLAYMTCTRCWHACPEAWRHGA